MTNVLYRSMDRAALDAAYNNGAAVGMEKRNRYMTDFLARSQALLGRSGVRRNLRYGDSPRNTIDFLPCGNANAPTFVFIHGGYWQMSDKETYTFLAAGPLAHGINVATIEYTLAPAIKMDRIVAEVKRALGWIVSHLGEFGAARDGVYVGGHSAGGHLTASVVSEPGVKGVLPISGLFDLEPIRLCYLNDAVRMDEAEARRNSPLLHLPDKAPPSVVSVGDDELPELRRQSADYYAAWTKKGLKGRYLPVKGHDHFSILEEFARPDGKLTAALLDLIAGRI
ncbi:MAG: alpha/beta hydrolase [Alphaproteobacteria bacterium]|nr:alpha/beta hydrolase [Alphaproteobacteria bacterium]